MLSEGRNEILGFPKPSELAPSVGVTHAQSALKTPKCERIPEDARAVLTSHVHHPRRAGGLNQSHDGIYMVVSAGHVGLTLALV